MLSGNDTIPLTYIKTVSTVDFIGTLAQNAMALANIALPEPAAHTNEIVIVGVNVQSVQNLDWYVFFWTKAAASNANLDLDNFLDYVYFPASSAKQIGGSGQYYYSSTGLLTRYRDLDNTKKLHIGLINGSATGKNATTTGAIVITVTAGHIALV